MKKFRALAVLLCALCAVSFSGCIFYGNDRSRTTYAEAEQTDAEIIYDISEFTYIKETLIIDKATGEARIEEGGEKESSDFTVPDSVVLYGNDFPRYSSYCAEGYEKLPDILTEKYEGKGVNFIQYYAVEYGGNVYGFCNLYSSATGFLAGGGQIDAKKIIAGVYFKYDKDGEELTQIERLGLCNIVAFNGQSVIYFKNRKYYAYTPGEKEKFICTDEAYDTGFTSYSYVDFFFNAEHCVIIMHRGYVNYKKDYVKIVVAEYDGRVLFSDKL